MGQILFFLMEKIYKMLFFSSMTTGTMITISSNNWLGMWMGLEINLLSIIPLLSSQKNAWESEAALKYFISQALASTVFLLSIMITLSEPVTTQSMNIISAQMMIMNSAILTKMGAAPFHFWFPEVMQGIAWTNSLILLTWQKIAPMIILMNSNKPMNFIAVAIISSMLISGIMGINQTSLRKMMAYSSINHIGWMLGSMISNQTIWMIYLIIYSSITLTIILTFKKLNSFYMNQLMNKMEKSKLLKMLFMLNFMSLGGLPPFIGFLPKWLTINFMIQEKMMMLILTMILTTLITLYFYLRITFSAMMISTQEMTTKTNNKINFSFITTMNLITILSLPLSTMMLNFL
uniref:NADH-ubiquinone oxidoreductase chain 2 n=1 Tax=Anthrenus sp. BMNH 840208 TaxID=904162 RepID=I7F2U2_9COLE|nr:NADH dehydrogenase subunit 2 [Anthrenus sp. BMNH 840208]